MIGMQVAALGAQVWTTSMKIDEAIGDYGREITRLQDMRDARVGQMEQAMARAKEAGTLSLAERAAQSAYDTRMATMKAEMVASGSEAKMAASGVRAKGTAYGAAQQTTDIAFAAAERTAESGAAGVKIGGLELSNTLKGAEGQKTLLTLEYGQNIAEQQFKKAELESNKTAMLWQVGLGGLAGLGTSFYQAARMGSFQSGQGIFNTYRYQDRFDFG